MKMLSLQRSYALHCNFGNSFFSVPLELSGQKEYRLRLPRAVQIQEEAIGLEGQSAHVCRGGREVP